MKEISTFKKISITITLFTGCAMCAVAQNSTTTVTPVATHKIAEQVTTPSGVDSKGSPYSSVSEKELQASYPWYNYKGITNIQEAKQQWILDNPEAYKAMSGGVNKKNPQ
ncbi:MAG TPA: hypothetical protein VK154_16545 [Chitinophagales bacterium]|nr:hypothetical protein [Chitinophagales bacterium]